MSHTNSTTNYSLPQFLTSDKPAWLTDINNAFSDIDTGMHNAQTKANTADSNASQALLDASAAATAASTADGKGSGAVASLADTFQTTETYAVGDLVMYNNLLYKCTVAVETPGAWTGSTNWTRATVEGVIDDLSAADISYNGDTVASAIGDIATQDFTFTPASGVNVSSLITSRTDKTCVFAGEFNVSAAANAWTVLGTTSIVPKVSHVTVPAINSSNGKHAGMVELRQVGNEVRFYPVEGLTNGYIIVDAAFEMYVAP